jgi:type I restriction enzyme S subunit
VRWPTESLGAICEIVSGITKDSKKQGDDYREVPYLRVANVQRLQLNLSEVKTIPAKESTIASYRLEPGDILLNEGGDRDKLGRGWIWQGQISECIHQNHVFRARIRNGKAIPKWIAYYANTNEARAYFLATGKQTTNLASISKKNLGALPVPLPPVDIQESIVAEIDTQLSRLDETITTLQGIQAKLKQARASVLKAAVEGRLVESEAELARIENRKYEHARDLIAASLKLREQQHESVQQTQGRKRTYRKPTSASHIPSQDASLLPPGWAYASTEEVTSGNPYSLAIGPFGSNLKVSDYKDRGVPLVFVRNVRSNTFSMDNTVFVSHEKANELKAHAAEPGDLLITKMGDPPGDSAIYPSGLPHSIITADVIRLNPSNRFDVQYLLYATKSSFFRLQIQLATKGVAQKKVSLERFSKVHFPIPPYAEQVRIVNEIDRRFSVLDQVEATVQTSLARCGLLRQAILKRAFRG